MIALKKSKFHSNAVREFKIPRECCFSLSVFFFAFEVNCTNANSGAIVKSLGGSLAYVLSRQCLFPPITKENKRACLGLFCQNKVLFIPEKRPFFRMIELTPSHLVSERKFARCGHRTRNATLSFVTTSSVSAWVERVCTRFIDIWRHMCVYGFCYWLIDLWPIKRYSRRGADRRKTFCARYVTGSL